MKLNFGQRQSSAIRLRDDELPLQLHHSFYNTSLKTWTWIPANLYRAFSSPDAPRLRDANKSLSHRSFLTSVKAGSYLLPREDTGTSHEYSVSIIHFLKFLSSPQGQTSTSAADNRLTNPKELSHTKNQIKTKFKKTHNQRRETNPFPKHPPKNQPKWKLIATHTHRSALKWCHSINPNTNKNWTAANANSIQTKATDVQHRKAFVAAYTENKAYTTEG